MHDFINIKVLPGASSRTKERLSRCKDVDRLFKFVKIMRNHSLTGDGFHLGNKIIMIALLAETEKGLWQTVWQGWIPEDDISWKLDE